MLSSDSILGGGAGDTFCYQLFIILKILGGGGAHALSPSPLPQHSLIHTTLLTLTLNRHPPCSTRVQTVSGTPPFILYHKAQFSAQWEWENLGLEVFPVHIFVIQKSGYCGLHNSIDEGLYERMIFNSS